MYVRQFMYMVKNSGLYTVKDLFTTENYINVMNMYNQHEAIHYVNVHLIINGSSPVGLPSVGKECCLLLQLYSYATPLGIHSSSEYIM